MSRAAVAFPGRGAYGPGSLRSLDPAHPWVQRADESRRAAGLPSLVELDAADRYDPAVHARPTNGWALTFVASLLDAERIAADHEVVVVVATSTGWYTALAAAGVLDLDDALRIVTALAEVAESPLADGERAAELVYPLADEAWQPLPGRAQAVAAALDAAEGTAERSLELGSHVLVGGTAAAIEAVAANLPPVPAGTRSFPVRLAGDGWHTSLRADAVAAAAGSLADIEAARPNVALVDGRGRRLTPWSADPAAILDDAIRGQPARTYGFDTSLRVALREYAPDVVLLPGPGASLGTACAHVIVADGYRGLRSRTEFEHAQTGPDAVLLSMRR